MSNETERLISRAALDRVDALRASFATAQPFRHVVVDDFLEPAFARQLLDEFPPFERGNFVGDDGQAGNKSTQARVRAIGPGYAALDAVVRSPEFLAYASRLTGIDELLYDPYYLGGGTHENRDGQGLQAHIDFNLHPSERWHRRLNLIVYLNPEWEAAWGGNLDLYRDPYQDARPAVRVVPAFNRCVVFETTEHSWHGFDPIALPAERRALSRKSFAIYLYTKDRPAEETAGKHSTHYVDGQLPERFTPGYVLDEDDVAQLYRLIAQRDDHLRRLYAENSSLLQAQERGLAGKLLYLLKRAYVRYRR